MRYIVFILFLFTACTKEYDIPEIIKIEEGNHNCTPVNYRSGKNISWSYTFDLTKANYCFPNLTDEQEGYDWNKLIGVKKNYFEPTKNSYMAGWRKHQNRIEWCHYWNDATGEFHFELIPINDTIVTVELYQEKDSLYISIQDYIKAYYMPEDQTLYFINIFFGGNHKAPNDLYFIRYKIR